MKKLTLITLLLSACLLAVASAPTTELNNDKKFKRLKAKADHKYEQFDYDEAIDSYKKALDVKLDSDVKLQLAKCYRLLNDPESAIKWYELALEDDAMSPADMLHYGQMLSAAGRYDESVEVLEKYSDTESWVDDKVEGYKNVDQFYRNEEAFTISEATFNSEHKDFSPTIRTDGVVFVTARRSSGMFKPEYDWDNSNFLDLFVKADGQAPEKIHRGINTRFHEGPASFFDNEQKMVFTRNNYNKQKAGKSDEGVNMLKLFYSEKKSEAKWEKPEELPFNSDHYSTGHPSFTTDGSTMYFASDMPGGYGGVDIYKVSLTNGVWGTPENVGDHVNTEQDEMFPFIHNDSILYFASNGLEGLGGLDIFRLNTKNNLKPRNLGYPVNTNVDDFGISVAQGSNVGYFSSNREGGTGDDDIYDLVIFDYIIEVNLIDSLTREPLAGDMDVNEILLPGKTEMVASTKDRSKVVFLGLRGSSFDVSGLAEEYQPGSLSIKTSATTRDIVRLSYDLPLLPAVKGEAIVLIVNNNNSVTQLAWAVDSTFNAFEGKKQGLLDYLSAERYEVTKEIVLNNIFYDFDKFNIREDAQAELDKLVVFLKENPETNVDLSSHTDIRGSNAYNDRLADNRARSAKAYLVENGIEEGRISIAGFGEKQTFDDCAECDEDQHQSNRRTEVKIIFED